MEGYGTVVAASKYSEDGILIASDTRTTFNDGSLGDKEKIFLVGEYGLGMAGDKRHGYAVMKVFEKQHGHRKPIMKAVSLLKKICTENNKTFVGWEGYEESKECQFVLCGFCPHNKPIIAHIFYNADLKKFVAGGRESVALGWGKMKGEDVACNGKKEAWRLCRKTIFKAMLRSPSCGGKIDRILLKPRGNKLVRGILSERKTSRLMRGDPRRNRVVGLRRTPIIDADTAAAAAEWKRQLLG